MLQKNSGLYASLYKFTEPFCLFMYYIVEKNSTSLLFLLKGMVFVFLPVQMNLNAVYDKQASYFDFFWLIIAVC